MTEHSSLTWILRRAEHARFRQHCLQSGVPAILAYWQGRDPAGNHVYHVEQWPWDAGEGNTDGLSEHLLPFFRTCPQGAFRLICIGLVPWHQVQEWGEHPGLASYVAVRLPTALERTPDTDAEVAEALAGAREQVPPSGNEVLGDLTGEGVLAALGLGAEDEAVANAVVGALLGVACPPGRFRMGSPADEPGSGRHESPHEAELTRAFALGQYPVPQALWQAVMGSNPSRFPFPARPVEQVSWREAVDFCNALSKTIGLVEAYEVEEVEIKYTDDWGIERIRIEFITRCDFSCNGFRLPTETEWEYACRAGTDTAFHSGACTTLRGVDPALEEVGWYVRNSDGETHTVGQKKPNPWGLYDMHGNVQEWVWDDFGDYPGAARDPTGPTHRSYSRVRRGGAWSYIAGGCRSASRAWGRQDEREPTIGFRLARTLR